MDWSETSSQLFRSSEQAQDGQRWPREGRTVGGRPRPCGGPGEERGLPDQGGGAGAGEVWAGQVSGPDGDSRGGGLGGGEGGPLAQAGPAVWVGGSRERPWAAAPIRPAGLRGRPDPAELVTVRGARPSLGSLLAPQLLVQPLDPRGGLGEAC